MREDYSADGDAWEYFPHDHARSRAYRWDEDGLAGICDRHQELCLALALWNGRDPILKERLFGLTGNEGNHGEDVKEYYFYLDSTPTHSYMRMLYKYPQAAFPYAELVDENRRRGRGEPEYELIDTGVFDERPLLRRVRRVRQGRRRRPADADHGRQPRPRGGAAARAADALVPQHVVVGRRRRRGRAARPARRPAAAPTIAAETHALRPPLALLRRARPTLLFTENETNTERLFGVADGPRYVKDGINDCVVHGRADAVNPARIGTKAAAHYALDGARRRQRRRVRLRFSPHGPEDFAEASPFDGVRRRSFAARQREADEFYATVIPRALSPTTRAP